MNAALRKKMMDFRPVLLVIPIVIVMVIIFMLLTRNVVLSLSKDKMAFRSQMYADEIDAWTEQILGQLNIYKRILDEEGELNEHTIRILSASYAKCDGYPFGLYWGDENENFYAVSGWTPGPEFRPTKRSWFAEGLTHTDSFAFGEPYLDMQTGKTCVCASVKMSRDGDAPASVMGADVYFDYLTGQVQDITRQEVEHAFLVTGGSRLIIADSDWSMVGETLEPSMDSELYRGICGLLDEGKTGMERIWVSGDGYYYIDICRIQNPDWFFVTCMRKDVMFESLRKVNAYISLIGVFISVVLIFLMLRASDSISLAAQQAKQDPLTKLLNRDGFTTEAKTALKNMPDQGVMLMFDVDNFKRVNDQLGHPAGDRFLKELAALLEEYFNRNTDTCARMGGDEFAIFLSREITREEVGHMLERFIAKFHATFDDRYADQGLSVSAGAAFAGADKGGSAFGELYRRADQALYQAKKNGKDRYEIEC